MDLLGQTRFPCSSDPSDKSLRDPSVPWTLFFGNSHLLLVVLAGTDGVFRTYLFQVGHGFVDIYNHFFFPDWPIEYLGLYPGKHKQVAKAVVWVYQPGGSQKSASPPAHPWVQPLTLLQTPSFMAAATP